MLAARYHGLRDVRIEDVPPPGASDLGPRDVLIAPSYTGICGTDLHEYVAGPIVTPTSPHPYTGAANPQILGHELSGVVLDVGSGVTTVNLGDRVSVMPLIYCGACYWCVRGLQHLCVNQAAIGLSWAWGGLGEQAVVHDYMVCPVPDEVSDLQAAVVEPMAVALYGVESGGIGLGSTVLITGAGPIGLLSVLAARACGATRVYVSEPNPNRAVRVSALDVDDVFDPRHTDVAVELRRRTHGIGVDVAVECVGNESALMACVGSTRMAGTVVQAGLHTRPAAIDLMTWARNDLTVRATWCYRVFDWPRILGAIARGQLPVERVVSSTITLNDVVEQGFQALLDPAGKEAKILVTH